MNGGLKGEIIKKKTNQVERATINMINVLQTVKKMIFQLHVVEWESM